MENIDFGKDLVWMKRFIFAGIFITENKLHAAYDRFGIITCKQWLLLAVLQAFTNEPDLSSLGEAMGCSRQNVKKISLSLEKEGYIELKNSNKDARRIVIHKTKKYFDFLKQMEEIGNKADEELFKEFTEEEIKTYYLLSKKIHLGIENVDEYFQKKKKEMK